MRKKLWAFILVTIFLLQACFPVAFAVSEKEVTASGLSFCNSDVPHGGTGNNVPIKANDVVNHVNSHNGSPPQGYKG